MIVWFGLNFCTGNKDIPQSFHIKQSVFCFQHIWPFLYWLFLKIGSDSCQEIPLSQLPLSTAPPSGTYTVKTMNCPGTPDNQNQTGDSVKRLASRVSFPLPMELIFQHVRKPLVLSGKQTDLQSLLGMPIVSRGTMAVVLDTSK